MSCIKHPCSSHNFSFLLVINKIISTPMYLHLVMYLLQMELYLHSYVYYKYTLQIQTKNNYWKSRMSTKLKCDIFVLLIMVGWVMSVSNFEKNINLLFFLSFLLQETVSFKAHLKLQFNTPVQRNWLGNRHLRTTDFLHVFQPHSFLI